MPLPARSHGSAPIPQSGRAFESFSRPRWAALGQPMAEDLSPSDVASLAATGESLDVDEVNEVYRPLAQLLALRAAAAHDLQRRTDSSWGTIEPRRRS